MNNAACKWKRCNAISKTNSICQVRQRKKNVKQRVNDGKKRVEKKIERENGRK